MGFLNHTTNNIIIDAVLTERGRELLSQNNGSFRIKNFSFGDDEVDYTLITKYGKVIGREKIEKNTPIFEANTNENVAIKHPLISFSNPVDTLTKIPKLKVISSASSITLKNESKNRKETHALVEVANTIVTSDTTESVDNSLVDRRFLLKVHNDLLRIEGLTPDDLDTNKIATYFLKTGPAKDNEFANQVSGSFTIFAKNVVNSNTFSIYADPSDNTKIHTQVQVVGVSSGASKIIPVVINKVV
tara:strand:+ start:3000 stop:3734 length:735 start_codon:yes stop_codon:yes gene_type:complete